MLTAGIDENAASAFLPEIGIEDIYEIEVELYMTDSAGQMLHGFNLKAVLDPEMKEAAADWELNAATIYEDEHVRVLASGLLENPDEDDNIHILFLVENRTDDKLTVDFDVWSGHINGEEIYVSGDPTLVYPDGTGLLVCEIWESELKDLGISKDEIVKLDLEILVDGADETGETERILLEIQQDEE